MAEMSKEMKIVFIINAIISFIYGFFYLVIPELYYQLSDNPNFDPITWRYFGGTLFILGIFNLLAVKRAEWEQVKIFLEMGILFLIMLLTISIAFIFITPEPTATRAVDAWIGRVVTIVIIVVNIYFYQREQKK